MVKHNLHCYTKSWKHGVRRELGPSILRRLLLTPAVLPWTTHDHFDCWLPGLHNKSLRHRNTCFDWRMWKQFPTVPHASVWVRVWRHQKSPVSLCATVTTRRKSPDRSLHFHMLRWTDVWLIFKSFAIWRRGTRGCFCSIAPGAPCWEQIIGYLQPF